PMCEKCKVDERCGITVAPFRVSRSRCRVLHNDDFETLFEQISEMRFHAHVRQHPTEDDLADAAFAQLQNQIVGLRAKYPVWTDNDRLAVFNVRLEALEPVGA